MEKTYKHICKDGREITLYPFFKLVPDEYEAVYALKKDGSAVRVLHYSGSQNAQIGCFEDAFFDEEGKSIVVPISASEYTLKAMEFINREMAIMFSDLDYENYGKE